MKRKAHGAQKPRHIKRIVEVASTAQRSDSLAQAINQRFQYDMSYYFQKVFIFFHTRKMLLSILLAAIIGTLAFSVSRISFVEDISSFLPNDADNGRINEAYQKIAAANKIIVTFSQKDTTQIDEELLTSAATRFAEILHENDASEHIKELMYEIDSDDIKEVTDFITQNTPYFLEEADYMRMNSLIQPQNIENQLKANKELLMSPLGGFVRNVALNDPLYFSQNALKNLEVFKQGDNYNTDNGFIFNDNGECIVIITSKYSISETNKNKLLAEEIYKSANQTIKEFDDEIRIVPFGAALISITNADQIKADSFFAISIAFVLILALLLYFFRNVKFLFFIILSVAFGTLFSLGVIALFKTTVSIIAFGIASVIIGVAITYPLHFLVHFRNDQNIKKTIKEIVTPLLIGNITTVGAFLSLLFISSDAMKDLGLISSFLLIGTIVFVLIFLPHFISLNNYEFNLQSQKHNNKSIFSRLAEFSPEKNKLIVSIFLLFTIMLFFFSFGTKFETNLQAINYMTDEQRMEMNKLIDENMGNGKTLYVVAEGENIDDALRNYEVNLLPRINDFSNISGISNLFPSKEMQKQKIEQWNKFWEWSDDDLHDYSKKDLFILDFKKLAEKQGFNNNAFENFIATLNKEFQPRDFQYFTPIFNNLGDNYFSISDDKTLIYTIFQYDKNQNTENQIVENNKNVFAFDDASIAQTMVTALSNDFNYVLYICGITVFIFLFFSFGRIELAILTFIPLTVAWVWILGLMNIFDLKFNIVNIILATFIFGLGDDYTIFVTEGLIYEYSRRKKVLASFKNSIFLSAVILFIAIGMLIFSKHPALRSLAELVVVGMISVVLCAYLFPPLIFKYLIMKKGKLRENPWTIWRFLKMVYSFAFFLMGILFATVYGNILFGFRKKASEKNKFRYHKLLQWAADFVIRRVPDVKFHYENLSGETFEKPAIIISNHQSHLDLMCLIMLTPKLIVLTNNWASNSPFYGRNIRNADYYPVSKGIENSVAQLSDAVQRGYSIVIFPEGTRSADCSIGRFHQGAFYLAKKLNLDIVPVFLHGLGHVLPKNDFLLRRGKITVQVHERITPDDSRFDADYSIRAKKVRQYYRETYAKISQEIETPDYFKSFVLNNYMYKGVEIWRSARKELDEIKTIKALDENTIIIENNGYGVYSFLYALVNKNKQVIAIDEDEDKVAIAGSCAGIPENLKIYQKSEWENISKQ